MSDQSEGEEEVDEVDYEEEDEDEEDDFEDEEDGDFAGPIKQKVKRRSPLPLHDRPCNTDAQQNQPKSKHFPPDVSSNPTTTATTMLPSRTSANATSAFLQEEAARPTATPMPRPSGGEVPKRYPTMKRPCTTIYLPAVARVKSSRQSTRKAKTRLTSS